MALRRTPINRIDTQPGVAGGTVVARIQAGKRGKRLHAVELALTAPGVLLPSAYFGDVRVIVDDKVRRTFTLAQLDDMMSFRDPALGVIDLATAGGTARGLIQFSEFDRKQYIASERFALDLLPDTEARIEMDYIANAAAGSIALDECYEDLDRVLADGKDAGLPNDGRNLGVMEWVRTPVNYNGTEYVINNLVNTGALYQISLYNPGAEPISQVQIDTDLDGIIHKRTKAGNDVELSRNRLFPSPGRFDFVPDQSDNPRHSLPWYQYGRFDVKVQTVNAANVAIQTIVQKYVQR